MTILERAFPVCRAQLFFLIKCKNIVMWLPGLAERAESHSLFSEARQRDGRRPFCGCHELFPIVPLRRRRNETTEKRREPKTHPQTARMGHPEDVDGDFEGTLFAVRSFHF